MREILFRGKRLDTGEWVYGQWLPKSKTICTETTIEGTTEYRDLFVAPETVGQYTGLNDKSGAKIFEGDIIRHYNRHDDTDYFYIGVIEWNEEKHGFANRCVKENSLFLVSDRCIYEVVGNIHDNPELLNNVE